MTRAVLNEGEREFGATVIDMGGGQTTVATMRAQELQFTNIYLRVANISPRIFQKS